MDNDKKTRLENLRSTILGELIPLVESVEMEPEQKFEILLSAGKLSGDVSNFDMAYNTAKKIEPVDQKVNAYLDLLDAIDVESGAISFTEEDTQPREQADSTQPEPEDNGQNGPTTP